MGARAVARRRAPAAGAHAERPGMAEGGGEGEVGKGREVCPVPGAGRNVTPRPPLSPAS